MRTVEAHGKRESSEHGPTSIDESDSEHPTTSLFPKLFGNSPRQRHIRRIVLVVPSESCTADTSTGTFQEQTDEDFSKNLCKCKPPS